MNAEVITLRILHIVPGALWVGEAIFMAAILEPILQRLGPEVGRPVNRALGKALAPVMTVTGLVTIGSGFALIARTPGRDFDDLFTSGWGWAIGIGLIAALAAFLAGAGTGVQFARMERAARATDAEMSASERGTAIEKAPSRIRLYSRVNALLVVVAMGAMAAARWV